ncbi:TetR/AcrR family transcriptional regulator [Motilimonas cestriensis]|uniref:TetR/AcrR family transcriptional regulator n=1 Tax=Motilimonas cestriensis TaxID=2742685 RepID=A0ABS8W767_9GAMM|nr:TetR/AcrR family transcriptional regulator [Motilimonas cestriensis]MCE2593659.1 TetR/AcrR family transcriptional regulator [Motilimonas cestriensis]
MGNDKRQLLIDTGLTLFYQQGINSVGINEILKVSGIAKKTLYHHFSSKEELVLAALEARDQRFITWLNNELTQVQQGLPNELSDHAKNQRVIIGLFNALTAWFNNQVPELSPFRGCFFINSSSECHGQYPQAADYCKAHKHKIRQLIQQHLPEADTPLLDLVYLLKEGAIVSAQVDHDLQSAQKCVTIIKCYLANQSSERNQ